MKTVHCVLIRTVTGNGVKLIQNNTELNTECN